MKIKLLNDYILFNYDEKKDLERQSEIVVSNVSNNKRSTVVVKEIGENVKKVKKGDLIVINPFVINPIKVEGKEFFIIREKHIYGIIKK